MTKEKLEKANELVQGINRANASIRYAVNLQESNNSEVVVDFLEQYATKEEFDQVKKSLSDLCKSIAHRLEGELAALWRESLLLSDNPENLKHDEFGGPVYSQEELVAEMTAAFVGMEAGLVKDRHEQSAAYLNSWLSVLKSKDHRRWIVQAASQATYAADFILGRNADEESPGEAEPDHQSRPATSENPEPFA